MLLNIRPDNPRVNSAIVEKSWIRDGVVHDRYQGSRITRTTRKQNYKKTFFKTTDPTASINQHTGRKMGEAAVPCKIKRFKKYKKYGA